MNSEIRTSKQDLRKKNSDEPEPLSPAEALDRFEVAEGFELRCVLSEPQISQPAFFNFDERGRMWVMNYLQYPNPAGLKMLSRDRFWRAVYDKVPVAPPNHARGADKITIHEDTDGDGQYDKHSVFVDGLSIATSFVRGRGGVWVLNPPYLLFYPDKNNDDVPDGDPIVHLEGFGIEDTHSCANSLRWGPDGWLYAGQGSTVTGNIRKPGDEKVVHSLGQLIWRYHPERKIYEIFAEGGGNTFGVEFDSNGRLFSGHNGGNTRGFHFVQGGYYRKGFGKHGPLSNPFAFGYFEAMQHHEVARFVHNFVIYESDLFPDSHHGNLFGVEPMQGQIVRTEMIPNGTSFQTKDIERIVKTDDVWFRPVDIKVGPDGAIYFADFYEPQISHREHFEGQIDKERGRIYRLAPKSSPVATPDLSQLNAVQLTEHLQHPNKWIRQTALRRLYDLNDPALIPDLEKQALSTDGVLDQLWALNACGGVDLKLLNKMIHHPSPQMREWAIRLMFDFPETAAEPSSGLTHRVELLASDELDQEVRSQLIASSQRMPNELAIGVIGSFLASTQTATDNQDIHIPLLVWWALEVQCTKQPEAVIKLIDDKSWILSNELFKSRLAENLMRRFALAGTRQDYQYCAELFELASSQPASGMMLHGFELAFKGRSMRGLPKELTDQLAKAGADSPTFLMRQGNKEAISKAILIIQDPSAEKSLRLSMIETIGEIGLPAGNFLAAAIKDGDEEIQIAGLFAARRFQDDALATSAIELYANSSSEFRIAAEAMLASRKNWTLMLLNAIDDKLISVTDISRETVQKMSLHEDDLVQSKLNSNWKGFLKGTNDEVRNEIKRIKSVLLAQNQSGNAKADPAAGKKIFVERCANCHQLYGEGGFIGPDLTSYNRSDSTNILINILNPNVEIREGFENFKILTLDGQIVVGFVADQDNKVVVVRGADGQTITIERDGIEEMVAQKNSLMPEGLLKELSDQQLRDLFAFIRSSQPLND